MKQAAKLIGMIVVAGVLAGCTTMPALKASILPQPDSTYYVVASASSFQGALNSAVDTAKALCASQQHRLIVLDRKDESSPHEMDPSVITANTSALMMVKLYNFGVVSTNPFENGGDTTTSIHFRCE